MLNNASDRKQLMEPRLEPSGSTERRSPRLVIVQNRETQFDAPLYERMQQEGRIDLTVFYSEPMPNGVSAVDREIGRAPLWDHLEPSRYRSVAVGHGGLRAALSIFRQIRALRPALVVIGGYFPRSHLLLALLLKATGIRIGLRSDNTLQHTRFAGLAGLLRRRVIGFIQRLFDTWHPVGTQAHAYLQRLSGTNRPTFPFPYAVDHEWFQHGAAEGRRRRAEFLRERGWPKKALVVLGILKWSPREDPLTLVDAFRLLAGRHPDARLILVGDGPLRQGVFAHVSDLRDWIHTPGYVSYSSLPAWYGRADVFVHPAIHEPWGVSVNEALSSGLTVVASSGVGAAAELVEPEGCGLIFPAGKAHALAESLETLMLNQELRSSLAAKASQVGKAHSSRETIAQLEDAIVAVRRGRVHA